MIGLSKKVLLLTPLFIIIFICILHTDSASAAFEPSKKVKIAVKIEKVNTLVAVKKVKIASRGSSVRTAKSLARIDIEDSNAVIAYARSFQGVSYKYGATGPDSYDCSAFTLTVMKKFGINLPRSSIAQSTYGTAISKGELQPGDLVFFATSGGRKVSHVGIYAGNNNFIHVSVSRGLTISSLNETYYKTRFVKATRVMG